MSSRILGSRFRRVGRGQRQSFLGLAAIKELGGEIALGLEAILAEALRRSQLTGGRRARHRDPFLAARPIGPEIHRDRTAQVDPFRFRLLTARGGQPVDPVRVRMVGEGRQPSGQLFAARTPLAFEIAVGEHMAKKALVAQAGDQGIRAGQIILILQAEDLAI